jgi:type IV pilus assembly protein PilW
MTMRSPRPPLGFTLIELVIAMAVTAIVLTAAIAASNSQQRAFYDGQRLRTAQGNARAALVYLEQKLPLAGWGMDPSLALDFRFYTPPASTCSTESPCPPNRDSTGNSDELVFYSRNPNYWVPANSTSGPYMGRVWNLGAITSADAQLTARTGDVFPNGQILQVVCPGTLKYAYFTVSTTTTATAAGALSVPLAGVVTSNPFRRQDVAVALGTVGCRVFQIDRYRFHIRPVLQGGGRYVPYLVLDRGIDANGDTAVDNNDEVLVAEGIEAFQVAYEFPNPDLGRAGATASTSISFSTALDDQTMSEAAGTNKLARTAFPGNAPISGQTVYTPSSFYRYSFSDPMRQTFHQANLRAVEIALVARSPDPAPTAPTNLQVDSTFRLFNQSGAPAWITGAPMLASGTDGYQRVQVDATVDLPNMTVRSIPGF